MPVAAGAPGSPVGQLPGTGTGPALQSSIPTLTIGGGQQANQGVINELGLQPPPSALMPPPPPSQADLSAGMAYGAAHQPPTAPEFMTPAMQAYVNQFQQSQQAQQQALNGSLVQALQGLGQRRDAAAKVAATLPGQFEQAYARANTSQQQAAKDAARAFAGPTTAGSADNPLIAASNADQRAAGQAAQPLLQAGITADYSKGATTLANTDMANKASLAEQQSQFDQQLAMAAQQWAEHQQQQQSAYAHDVGMAKLNSSLGVSAYEQTHPAGSANGMTAYDAAKLQLQADDQAKKAGWTGMQGQQAAQIQAPTLLARLSNDRQAGDRNAVKTQILHDPDLTKWFTDHGYAVVDPTTKAVTFPGF